MKKSNLVSFHVDLDSPAKLLEYWAGVKGGYDSRDLDRFYSLAMDRALKIFKAHNIHATFFCVGEELDNSKSARDIIKEAYSRGHEIANHTYSHPYGLIKLDPDKLHAEIEKCSDVIRSVTGAAPAGFRSPGYDMSNLIMDTLERLSFQYDSSAFWSVLIPLMKYYHKLFRKEDIYSCFGGSSARIPRVPYYPSKHNWVEAGPARRIIEIPLPRTGILGLPFYSNFHIFAGSGFRRMAIRLMRQPYIVYLFHIIEFVDFGDGMPKELMAHPTLRIDVEKKLAIINDTIRRLTERYEVIKTADFIRRREA